MKLTRQQVLDLLVRAEAAGLLPADGPTSLFVAQKRGAPLQLAVAASDSKIVVRLSRLPFRAPLVFFQSGTDAALILHSILNWRFYP